MSFIKKIENKNDLNKQYKHVMLCLIFIFISTVNSFAQNLNLSGGGLTVGSGVTLNVPGSITVGNATTVTNNDNIILAGDWTNNGSTYTGTGGTVNFTGSAVQLINGTSASTFNNVKVNQSVASSVTMNKDVVLTGDLFFLNGKISIGSNSLTLGGAVTNTVTEGLTGSNNSNIIIASNNSAGTLSFDQTTPDATNVLKYLTLNSNASAGLGNALNMTDGSPYGIVSLASGATLTTNDILTLKSDSDGTARVDEIPVNGSGVALATVSGKVTIERYLPMFTPYSSRRWRLLTAPISSVNAPSINEAWQEGATSVNRLAPVNPNPGYGTPITDSTVSLNGYDQGSTNNPSIYYTNPGSNVWSVPAATNAGKITDNTGSYMIFIRGDRSIVVSTQYINTSGGVNLRVKGRLNMGDITTPTVFGAGLQLLGNPYPSTISFNNVSYNGINPGSTVGSTYYLWDPVLIGSKGVGKWVTFSSDGDNTYTFAPYSTDPAYMSQYLNTGLIESGAAFAIQPDANDFLIIHESDKVNSSTTIGLSSRPADGNKNKTIGKLYTNLFYINGAGAALLADGVATIYGDDYKNEVDKQDAVKLNTFSTKESIGLLRDGIRLAIERRETIGKYDTIFYSTNLDNGYRYQLQFNAIDFEKKLNAVLEDKFTKISTEIKTDGMDFYNFVTTADPASAAADRFRIVFGQNTTVPVLFSMVKAHEVDKNIFVEWNVENQINIKQYEIERSADGIHFNLLSVTPSKPDDKGYTYTDEAPLNGYNYYRIKSVSNTGETMYSNIVKVDIVSAVYGISVNSVINTNGEAELQFNKMKAGVYSVRIFNTAGQMLLLKIISHSGGSAVQKIPLEKNMAAGVYQLEVSGPDFKSTIFQIVKK